MRRTGLTRHSQLDDAAGDPLDGLVNLFDVGLVLAVAFLIAGLGLSLDDRRLAPRDPAPAAQAQPSQGSTQPLPAPSSDEPATGRGRAVGMVYRLPDGRLVYVEEGGAAP